MSEKRKTRCAFMIDRDILQRLHEIQVRTGLSTAEQIRQGIRWWLEAREWPDDKRPNDRRGGGGGRIESDMA
jgi:hypothetical protein